MGSRLQVALEAFIKILLISLLEAGLNVSSFLFAHFIRESTGGHVSVEIEEERCDKESLIIIILETK